MRASKHCFWVLATFFEMLSIIKNIVVIIYGLVINCISQGCEFFFDKHKLILFHYLIKE
jgi:hypothetical protein